MNRKDIETVLAVHADQLVSQDAPRYGMLTRNDQVKGLLDLAEQLQGILRPIEPDPDFRRRLHGQLILDAQRRQLEVEPNRFQQHRKGIILGAAAVGSVASVAGVVIAFVWRHRHGRAPRIATG